MPFGLLTGLGAALSWGTMDIASALASRRVGSLRLVAGVQLVGAAILGLIATATATGLPTDPATLAICAILGVIGAGAYLAYFTGLQVGPISVVSGMVAAYGGLTVVLAVVLRGETLTPTQALGATIATLGVILTGVAFDGGWRATRFAVRVSSSRWRPWSCSRSWRSPPTSPSSPPAGPRCCWWTRLVNAGISIVAVAGLVVLARRRRPAAVGGTPATGRSRAVGTIVVAGALDVIGLIAFAIGLETAPTWLVGLASAFGPAVTIIVAVALLGGRLKPIQWLGLVGVAIGMVAIALP